MNYDNYDLTLYLDQRTGAALMIASNKDETVYFPYSPDTGEYSYGMHGQPLKGLPTQYFAALNPNIVRDKQTIERDLQVVKVKGKGKAA
jgi:hypothetical protein